MMRQLLPMRGHLSDKICDQILREGTRSNEWQDSLLKYSKPGEPSPEIRSSQSIHLVGSTGRFIRQNVQEIFHYGNHHYGFNVFEDYEIELIRYTAEQEGKFEWHYDDTPADDIRMDRKLSMTIQLSTPDQYEGGDLEFKDLPQQLEDIKGRGTVIMFPSFMMHRVTPITSGTRYVLVAWQYGPEWR